MGPDAAAVAERYARFARDEAPARSELYAHWAAGVAADPRVCALLARIPPTRRQPPLVFAVTRLLGAPEADYAAWAAWVAGHADALVAEASRRSLQTNEPLRCAALLPALATVDGPITLVELGASAGLCLYPDRYSYRYGDVSLDPPAGESTVVLTSRIAGHPPLRMPEVVGRRGVDLAPLSARDRTDRAFLEALVWPGETGRRARIAAALDIVADDPPILVTGDAGDPALVSRVVADAAAAAPAGATVVVTTPGVLPHMPRAGRERLIRVLREVDAVWISIDPPGLHDAWVAPVDEAGWGGFVLGRDARPLAAVDPLGGFVEWRAG